MRLAATPAFGRTHRKPDFEVSKMVYTPTYYQAPSPKFQNQVNKAFSSVMMEFTGRVRHQILAKGLRVQVFSEKTTNPFVGVGKPFLNEAANAIIQSVHNRPEEVYKVLQVPLQQGIISSIPDHFISPKAERQFYRRLVKKLTIAFMFKEPGFQPGTNLVLIGEKGFKKALKKIARNLNPELVQTQLEKMIRHEVYHFLDEQAVQASSKKIPALSWTEQSPQFKTTVIRERNKNRRILNPRLQKTDLNAPLRYYLPQTSLDISGLRESFAELGSRLTGQIGTCSHTVLPPVFPKTSKLIEDRLKRLFKVRHLFARV